MAPRDIVAIILAAGLLMHPLAVVVSLALLGRPLTQIGGETLEAIEVATLAVIAGYLAQRTDA
jgi:hypothetical protein